MNKILIIEDDKNIAELEKDYLNIEGLEAVIISDGLEGINEALKGGYDLIILDLMIPEIDGFGVLRDVRDKIDIPIIIISARESDMDKVRGLGLGADDYMTKPFSPSELVARVKSHLKRYQRIKGDDNSNQIIEINGLLVDKDSRRVFVLETEVILTSMEFDLLYFLVSNANIVFSKDTLFRRLWDEEDYGDINTVAVHIQKIRKKIEKDPSNPRYIETLWGSGYRFNK
jgi:DNA-binding response OmpR family regulator